MKNLHLLPTDKPSRLGYLTKRGKEVYKDLRLFDTLMPNILDSENQNIYITNDEEIKEGDWITNNIEVFKPSDLPGYSLEYANRYWQKIILTTDQDLIEDGVQAIDDEFLQWFVKNPSCEEVEVEKGKILNQGSYITGNIVTKVHYETISPKEEPKQETTLEEVAKNYSDDLTIENLQLSFINGAKWQAERMYSEEDMKQFAWECVANFLSNNVNEVEMALVEVIIDRNNKGFEQFKKK